MMKLLFFSSKTCGPCKLAKMALNAIEDDIEILKLDVEENRQLAEEAGVLAVPHMVLLDSEGKTVKEHTGVLNVNQLKEFIE